jgi:hypothetical protein
MVMEPRVPASVDPRPVENDGIRASQKIETVVTLAIPLSALGEGFQQSMFFMISSMRWRGLAG